MLVLQRYVCMIAFVASHKRSDEWYLCRPAEDRKAVKDVIVEMTKAAKQ